MIEENQFEEWINESEQIQYKWQEDAKNAYKIYRGDQWPEDLKQELEEADRPALVLNIVRPFVKLLTGYERQTRYDMKVLPVGDVGDDFVANILTQGIKNVENNNMSQFLYSESYRYGLIGGRGWLKTSIDYAYNYFGDINVDLEDSHDITIDPFSRRHDIKDARYLYKDVYLTEDELDYFYPESSKEIKQAGKSMSTGTYKGYEESYVKKHFKEASSGKKTPKEVYAFKEFWYKEYERQYYLVNLKTGDLSLIKKGRREDAKMYVAQNPEFKLVSFDRPNIHYAVWCDGNIIEQGKTPYAHNMFPYIPFYAEFVPSFGDLDPQWVGLIYDLIDAQREKNKRRSQYLDILSQVAYPGHRYESGAVENEDELDRRTQGMDYRVKMKPGKFEAYQEIRSDHPDASILQLDAMAQQDIREISGIHAAMLGTTEGSRESGRSIALRQQQGAMVMAPFQDNMRITRKLVAKQIMALLGQIYTVGRWARLVSPDGTLQSLGQSRKGLQTYNAIIKIRSNRLIDKYDVELAQTPSTPTNRAREFMELMDMVKTGVIPITPEISKLIIKASDLSLKSELMASLTKEMQKATQQAMASKQK